MVTRKASYYAIFVGGLYSWWNGEIIHFVFIFLSIKNTLYNVGRIIGCREKLKVISFVLH